MFASLPARSPRHRSPRRHRVAPRRLIVESLESRVVLSGTWTAVAPLPVAVGFRPHTEAISGKIYVAGGNDGVVGASTKTQIYDPGTDSWSFGADLSRRYDGSSGVVGGKLYLAGGWNFPDSGIPTRTLQVYDPVANSWSNGPIMPAFANPPLGLSGCSTGDAIGDRFYVLSACNGFSGLFKGFAAFDVGTNSWVDLPDPAGAHADGAAGVIDGKLYIAGGADASSTASGVTERYDPVTNSWTTLAAMPTPRSGVAGAVLDGKLYTLGGWDGVTLFDTVEVYDPVTDSWSAGVPLTSPRQFVDAATIGDSIYVTGGSDSSGSLDTVEVFQSGPTSPVEVFGGDLVITGGAAGDSAIVTNSNTPGELMVRLNGDRFGPFLPDSGGRIVVNAGDGNDRIVVSARVPYPLVVDGGAGNDIIAGGNQDDTLSGGAGNDRIFGGNGDNTLDGGDDDDRLYGRGGNDTLIGGGGNDTLSDSGGDNVLDGGDGDDRLASRGGDDLLRGGAGNDTLNAGSGADILLGGMDDDQLFGRGGRDLLIGGSGLDSVRGDGDEDILVGGTTSHDTDDAALRAILAEWTMPTSMAARVATIMSGGFAAPLNLGTVTDDGDLDTLNGGSGDDWYFNPSSADRIRNLRPGDRVDS